MSDAGSRAGRQAPPTPSIRIWSSSWRAEPTTCWCWRATISTRWATNLLLLFPQGGGPGGTLWRAGDHIYRMDYKPIIAFHQERRADVTLGAAVVRLEESHRFGILETDA